MIKYTPGMNLISFTMFKKANLNKGVTGVKENVSIELVDCPDSVCGKSFLVKVLNDCESTTSSSIGIYISVPRVCAALKNDSQFTASAKLRGFSNSARIRIGAEFSKAGIPDKWGFLQENFQIISLTSEMLEGSDRYAVVVYLSNYSFKAGDWFEITDLKLEIGDKVTPYSLGSEDYSNPIEIIGGGTNPVLIGQDTITV